MKIRIDKQSEVPVHHQLREQIIFLIGTAQLSIGDTLPSVRELAHRLKIHHNTVSHVYADLVRGGWLINRRGSRLVVAQPGRSEKGDAGGFEDLDDLLNLTIRLARERGYSLQQLVTQVRKRLLAEPPDHLLIVEPERELGELMKEEIRRATGQVASACSLSLLQQNPSLAIGAVLLTPSYLIDGLERIPSKDRTVVSITYSPAEDHLAAIRNLTNPSVIGVLSVSPAFLKTASGLLAPAIGGRHSFREFIMLRRAENGRPYFAQYKLSDYPKGPAARSWAATDQRSEHETSDTSGGIARFTSATDAPPLSSVDLQAIDVLFCDSITYRAVRHSRRIMYRLLSEESLGEIASTAEALIR
jgi:GntR family transcriptional regulator